MCVVCFNVFYIPKLVPTGNFCHQIHYLWNSITVAVTLFKVSIDDSLWAGGGCVVVPCHALPVVQLDCDPCWLCTYGDFPRPQSIKIWTRRNIDMKFYYPIPYPPTTRLTFNFKNLYHTHTPICNHAVLYEVSKYCCTSQYTVGMELGLLFSWGWGVGVCRCWIRLHSIDCFFIQWNILVECESKSVLHLR